MDLLLSILTVYGLSAIVTISKIFEPVRDLAEKHSPNFWKYLTACMQCLPFWVGIFISLVMGTPLTIKNEIFNPNLNLFFTYLFSGALFSGTTMLIHTIFVFLKGDNWNKIQEDERKRKIKKGILKSNP